MSTSTDSLASQPRSTTLTGRPRGGTAAAGGLLWFAAASLVAFGGPSISSHLTDYGATLSAPTLATLRAAQWLSAHAVVTAAVLGAIVILTLLAGAVSRRFRAIGALFLLSGMLAWGYLAGTLLWPAIHLARAVN